VPLSKMVTSVVMCSKGVESAVEFSLYHLQKIIFSEETIPHTHSAYVHVCAGACHLACGVKWNFVLMSVGPSLALNLVRLSTSFC
jgi:hypothetical protein